MIDNTATPGDIQIIDQKSLAPLTTIGIGGPAGCYTEVDSVQKLVGALKWANDKRQPVLILGGGSNVLVADSGWPGLVIRMGIKGMETSDLDDGEMEILAGAGENWDNLVGRTVELGLQGIECLSGIPGLVGGCPIQNIGAYGQEVGDTIIWVEALHRESLELRRFNADECGFGYRWSRFKGEDRDKYVITRVAFQLKKDVSPTIRYGDLSRRFESAGNSTPSLSEVRDAVLDIRRSKGMVVDADIPDSRSCGSFFMNPIVTEAEASRIREIAQSKGLLESDRKMPEYPAEDGQVKLSAAWLMQSSGLEKGFRMSGVGLSSRHILALVNRGGGTSAEILKLVDYVQDAVRVRFGVELHPEPVFVGFDLG